MVRLGGGRTTFRGPAATARIRWEEIDLEQLLIVRRRRKTGQPLHIPLVDHLAVILARWPGITGPVCRRLPKYYRNSLVTLHRIFDRAGLPKASRGRNGWHRLRHTAATILDAHGASVVTIGRVMGHKPGSAQTLRYITPDIERERVVMEKASSAVRSGSQ